MVAVVALGAAAAALWSDAAPTMWPVADAVWRAAAVAVIGLAGTRARRWTLVWLAVPGVLLAVSPYRFVALAALAIGAALLLLRRRDRVGGAIAATAGALALLHLSWPQRWPEVGAATAAIAAVAVAPALVTAYQLSRRRTRRAVRFTALALVALGVAGLVGVAVFARSTQDDVSAAVSTTERAIDAVTDSDPTAAQAGFEDAAAQFGAISERADSWWLYPARAVPVLGPNVEVVRAASASGAGLGGAASELSTTVDQDALRGDRGGIDVAVLASLEEPISQAVDEVTAAQDRLEGAASPWVLPPLRSRLDDFTTELDQTRDSAEIALEASRIGPRLLGAEGPKRYVMLLGNPAEGRDIGGHLGNWAEVTAVDGRLELVDVGGPYELFSPRTSPPPRISGSYPQSLLELRPQYFPQNWGGSPDLPTVARLTAELFPQARPGAPVDGVFYADPEAFAALMTLTGPVLVPGTDVTLDSDNAVQFLTVDQFDVLGNNAQGSEQLTQAIEEVVQRFSSTRLPEPRALADLFGPVVDAGRLQFFSLDPRDDDLLERVGLSRTITRSGADDVLGVVTRNANPNKADSFLERDVTYDVNWDPITGESRSTVTVTVTNTAPSAGLPEAVLVPPSGGTPGTNRFQLSVFSPLEATGATLDGAVTGIGRQYEAGGVYRNSVWVTLAPGQTSVVTMDLEGPVGTGTYRLRWLGQPLVRSGTAEVTVRADGVPLRDGGSSATQAFPLESSRQVEVRSRLDPPPSDRSG